MVFRTKQEVDEYAGRILAQETTERGRTMKFFEIARAYQSIQEFGFAKRFLQSYIDANPTPSGLGESLGRMGDILMGLEDFEGAYDSYKKCFEITPSRMALNQICDLLLNGFGVDQETPESTDTWFAIQSAANGTRSRPGLPLPPPPMWHPLAPPYHTAPGVLPPFHFPPPLYPDCHKGAGAGDAFPQRPGPPYGHGPRAHHHPQMSLPGLPFNQFQSPPLPHQNRGVPLPESFDATKRLEDRIDDLERRLDRMELETRLEARMHLIHSEDLRSEQLYGELALQLGLISEEVKTQADRILRAVQQTSSNSQPDDAMEPADPTADLTPDNPMEPAHPTAELTPAVGTNTESKSTGILTMTDEQSRSPEPNGVVNPVDTPTDIDESKLVSGPESSAAEELTAAATRVPDQNAFSEEWIQLDSSQSSPSSMVIYPKDREGFNQPEDNQSCFEAGGTLRCGKGVRGDEKLEMTHRGIGLVCVEYDSTFGCNRFLFLGETDLLPSVDHLICTDTYLRTNPDERLGFRWSALMKNEEGKLDRIELELSFTEGEMTTCEFVHRWNDSIQMASEINLFETSLLDAAEDFNY